MIRAAIASLLPIFLTAIPASPETSSKSLGGAVVILIYIGSFCSTYYPVNKPTVDEVTLAVLDEGKRLYGSEYFEEIIAEQSAALVTTVHATGERKWCFEQRGTMRQRGSDFFPVNPPSR